MTSFRGRLLAAVLGIFVIAMGVLAGLNYRQARNIIIENVNARLESESASEAAAVGNWARVCLADVRGMSESPQVQNGEEAALPAFMQQAMSSRDSYEGLTYARTDGTWLNSFGQTGNISQRLYFQKAMQGEPSISNTVVSKGTGKMIVNVVTPVKRDGRVTGMLSAQVQLDEVKNRIESVRYAETGFAYLVQDDGIVIAHPDSSVMSKELSLPNQELQQKIAGGVAGTGKYDMGDQSMYAAVRPVEGTPWTLVLTVPADEVEGVLSSFTYTSLITILVVLAVASLFMVKFANSVSRPIEELAEVARRIAQRDLKPVVLRIGSKDEIGRLGENFAKMSETLRTLIRKIQEATDQLSGSSDQLNDVAGQSAQASQSVAESITRVAEGTTTQMTSAQEAQETVEKLVENMARLVESANQAVEHTKRAASDAHSGDDAVQHAVQQMTQVERTVLDSAGIVQKLGERSKEINQIVDMISSIAGQTTLLSLNAAIEAARAGEQGRGFAVVADEVRKLADQSQQSAEQISALIKEIQDDTERAVASMNTGTQEVKAGSAAVGNAGNAFRNIASLVENISEQSQGISEAMGQMAQDSRKVVESIQTISDMSRSSAQEAETVSAAAQEQSASMEEIAAASRTLANLAQDLQGEVHGFKL